MSATQDLFVGLLAVGIGSLLIAGAALQSPALLRLAKSRLLIDAVGLTGARWFIAACGLASVLIGLLIASGWRVRW